MADIEDYSLSFEGSEVEVLLQKIKLAVSGIATIDYRNGRSNPSCYEKNISNQKFSLFTNPVCVLSINAGDDTYDLREVLNSLVPEAKINTSTGNLRLRLYYKGSGALPSLGGARKAYINYTVTEANI